MNKCLNPFRYIAGGRALAYGALGWIIASLLAYQAKLRIYGINAHLFPVRERVSRYFEDGLVNFLLAVLLFSLLGCFFSRTRPRMVDILGTFSFSFLPNVLTAATALIPLGNFPSEEAVMKDPSLIPWRLIVIGLLMLVFSVWQWILLFHAYKTCFNLKGWRLTVSFGIGFILFVVITSIPVMVHVLFFKF